MNSRVYRNERTTKQNTGQAYVSAKGKEVRARAMKQLKDCTLKCKQRLPEPIRQAVFREYWSQGDHQKRVVFTVNLVH